MSLHPFFVHFPIAFWLLGSCVLLVAWLAKKDVWWDGGWFLLYCATLMTIPAVLSGQKDYEKVTPDWREVLEGKSETSAAETHAMNPDEREGQKKKSLERHRDLGNFLPWIMGLVCLLRLHGVYAKKSKPLPRAVFAVIVLGLAVLLTYAAYLGGTLVHVHEMRLQ